MSDKAELSRAGTMVTTAKEGKAFLEKNLTEWKKPFLMDDKKGGKKAKMAKQGTMKATAQEGNALLDSAGRPDEDAHTRGQQKKIEDIKGEKKGTKKKGAPKKMSSMAKTAAEAKALVGKDLDLSGGRQLRKRPPAPERVEAPPKKAKAKAPAKKPELKKEGTMQKTAKEGKEFLKRGRKPKAGKNKGKAAAKKNEKEKEEEEERDETS